MEYRKDVNLEFLQHLKHEELEELENILLYGMNKEDRIKKNTVISSELAEYSMYKTWHNIYRPNCWEAYASELQHYGGNTIMNTFRKTGVLYQEILEEVMGKVGVKFHLNRGIESNEQMLLIDIFDKAFDVLSPEEKEKILKALGSQGFSINGAQISQGIMTILKIGGFKSYQLLLIVANQVSKFIFGRGIALAGNVLLTQVLLAIGPIGWAITGVWKSSGAAYRITIPAVVQVAILRIIYNAHQYDE
ncbi:MAG: DUF3944 domain-containing protein [Fusobacteriaceae bacterium]|nr:DUF3944 domain-containing protein [Fusobacteriaceae bacterium]